MHSKMKYSTNFLIRSLLYFTLVTSTVATWSLSGWDGLACGDVPQTAQQFVWEQEADVIKGCVTLDPGPKAYSMMAETDTSDIEIWGYALPGCGGARKRVERTCTNPDISFPYFASYEVVFIE
ncbi:uncharacterized protein N7482_000539 [Penicillium canariense]|uniref:Uncharacterized protein n=1 Tax=Penicillium canariense TaxID=189055 RepID=A0A9W9LT84_9EURO|nr:uncharacterized protein N7482_000539 [Penicillium canariense]KAJ5174662.1 hypothetical protein N7482_000539 [Penicillium canariense]